MDEGDPPGIGLIQIPRLPGSRPHDARSIAGRAIEQSNSLVMPTTAGDRPYDEVAESTEGLGNAEITALFID